MPLTAQEKAARRESFRRMGAAEKLDYLFTYYKLPIVLTLLLVYVLCYGGYQYLTKKETLLYAACVNVAADEDTDPVLSGGFVRFSGGDVHRQEVLIYHALYLSDRPAPADHEYAYASRLKLMASVNAERLDVVFMNQEAYDLLSADDYLLELPAFITEYKPELRDRLLPCLAENAVRPGDSLTESSRNHSVRQKNAVEITAAFESLGFTGRVYWGVLQNTPRPETAAAYLAYLSSLLPESDTQPSGAGPAAES